MLNCQFAKSIVYEEIYIFLSAALSVGRVELVDQSSDRITINTVQNCLGKPPTPAVWDLGLINDYRKFSYWSDIPWSGGSEGVKDCFDLGRRCS